MEIKVKGRNGRDIMLDIIKNYMRIAGEYKYGVYQICFKINIENILQLYQTINK